MDDLLDYFTKVEKDGATEDEPDNLTQNETLEEKAKESIDTINNVATKPQEKKKRQLPSHWNINTNTNEAKKSKEDISEEERVKKANLKSEAKLEKDATHANAIVRVKIPQKEGRIICFDLETTGFSSKDRIIEIGATEIINGKRTRIHFRSYCCPTVLDDSSSGDDDHPHQETKESQDSQPKTQSEPNDNNSALSSNESSEPVVAPAPVWKKIPKMVFINPYAFEAHQLRAEFIAKEDPIEDVLQDFLSWIDGADLLVAHNAAFDLRMFLSELNRYDLLSKLTVKRVFCTQQFFRKMKPNVPYSLSDLCTYFRINSARLVHGAGVDAEILSLIYQKILEMPELKNILQKQ